MSKQGLLNRRGGRKTERVVLLGYWLNKCAWCLGFGAFIRAGGTRMSTELKDVEKPEVAVRGRDTASLAGKYLTFKLAREEYGIEILKVVEINKLMEITKVPRTPEFVRGVINLRGKVIPVVELRRKFGMETIADADETCIIVVRTTFKDAEVQMGILVDTVSEVLDIAATEIEPAPRFGSSVDTDFILGMAKTKGSVKILLDIDRILTGTDLAAITQIQ